MDLFALFEFLVDGRGNLDGLIVLWHQVVEVRVE